MKSFVPFFVMCLLRIGVHAQDTLKCNQDYLNDPLLEQMNGNWTGSGEVMGEKVGYRFSVQWVLNHQFLEMNFSDTSANPAYVAKVSIGYDCDKKKYIIHWLDNFGAPYSETLGYGIRKGDAIEMSFDYPDGKMINTFSFDSNNHTWTSHAVSLNKDGRWVSFANILMTPVR